MLEEIVAGLQQCPKTLPCKYFYNSTGSQLFEKICHTKEYYITRAELEILQNKGRQIAKLLREDITIIEPGAGALLKIEALLQNLHRLKCYIPTDISADFLALHCQKLQHLFPHITIKPASFDFLNTSLLSDMIQQITGRIAIYFPGSTLGNLTPVQAQMFLQNISSSLRRQDCILIGIDLIKETNILEAAYNDIAGYTAKFNRNILTHCNQKIGSNFETEKFQHLAFFNREKKRVEMHLVSLEQQTVSIGSQKFTLSAGERIHTENSYKYSVKSFQQLALKAGIHPQHYWLDRHNNFSVHYLVKH